MEPCRQRIDRSRGKLLTSWAHAFLPLLPSVLGAQEGAARFDHLTVADGLSHSTVWSILQDSRGFLWIGTSDGLNRYDGYSFEVFTSDPEDPDTISESEVMALFEDRGGVLWLATRGGGLNRFDQAEERFTAYRHDPDDPASLSHDEVWSILEDRDGALWVGTDDGLDRLDRRTGRFTRFLHDPADPGSLGGRVARVVLEDRDGTLWVGTDRGLDRFDRDAGRFRRCCPGTPDGVRPGRVLALHQASDGYLWVGAFNGLFRLDPAGGGLTPFGAQGAPVQSLFIDSRERLWIGRRGGGLEVLDPASSTSIRYRHQPGVADSLSNDSITAIAEDRTGILWIGTYGGVDKYDRRREQFVVYRHRSGDPDTLSGNSVAAIYEDGEGELWVGNYNLGLNRFDRERRRVTRYPPRAGEPGALQHGTVTSVVEGRGGELWVGTWGGLHTLDRATGHFTAYRHDPGDPSSLGNDVVLALREDLAGRLWVGTFQGISHLEPDASGRAATGRAATGRAATGRRFVRYPRGPEDPASLGQDAFYAILEDREGVLWFGSDGSGLLRLEDERFATYRHDAGEPSSLASDRISSLYEDREGRLWVGTRGSGLNRFDRARQGFLRYRTEDGLPSDSILGIVEDDDGHLWLATSQGLSHFDPSAESFDNFSVEDGLPGNIFSTYGAFRSPRGELFFGGPDGLTAFFPDRVTTDTFAPPALVTAFELFNRPAPLRREDPDSPLEKSILATREIVLSHRHDVFSFEFATLHFRKPHKHRYAYRLEGFDRDWVFTDSRQRSARYTNLDPGRYVFRVKGSNGDGVWNDEETSLRIVVRPAPWKSRWAYSLYALALVTYLGFYLRSQRRKFEAERAVTEKLRRADKEKDALIAELEDRNAELERFTYTVSHDLKTPLVTIKGFLGMAAKDMSEGRQDLLRHDLGRIGGAADRMARLLDELLEYSRIGRVVHPSEKVPVGELAWEAGELLSVAFAEKDVELEISPDLPVVFGDRLRLSEVLQNLLENAVKFLGDVEGPRVAVTSWRDDGEDVICVEDNGRGIDPRYHEKIFLLFERLDGDGDGTGIGLALVKRIVEAHGGRIWVESRGEGHGTRFCFTIPGDPPAPAPPSRPGRS